VIDRKGSVMKKSFNNTLTECTARLESGEELESVLGSYPEHQGALRRHLHIWAALAQGQRAEMSPEAMARGAQRLSAAVFAAQTRGGKGSMNNMPRAGLALRLAAGVTVVAAVVLGALYFGGVQVGSKAEALPSHPCLDQVLGGLDGNPGFDVRDIIAFKIAYKNQIILPRFDRNGDGHVGIDDLKIYIQELKACFRNVGP
jgi:hypothetical protein